MQSHTTGPRLFWRYGPGVKRSAGALLGLLWAAPVAAADDPVVVRNARALSLPFLRLTPRTDVDGLEKRRRFIRATVANDFRQTARSLEDYEVYRVEFGASEPTKGGCLEWTAAAQTFGGGFLDPIIDGWHSGLLGWSHPRRDRAPFGRSRIETDGRRTELGAGLADLKVQWNRRDGNRVFSVAVELPTGDARRALGSGDVDFGIGVGLPLFVGKRWSASLHLAGVWQGPNGGLDDVRPFVDQETVSFSYRARQDETWHVQWQSEASARQTGIPESDATHRIWVFAWRKQAAGGQTLEFYFTEDRDLFTGGFPALADVGPDFAFGVNWSWSR